MLELKNPPPQGHHAGVQFYNFTMRIHGNVFDNSPGAQGYFEMPKACHYERNHSVLAMFNASRGQVHSQHTQRQNLLSAGDKTARPNAG